MASLKMLSLAAILALLFLSAVKVTAGDDDDDDDDDEDDDDDDDIESRFITEQDDDDDEYGDLARVLARASDSVELETPELPTSLLLKKARRLLRAADEDGDGHLQAEEIREWLGEAVQRIRTHDTATTFDERDQDDDGKVTWEEVLDSDPEVDDPQNVEASLPHEPRLKELKQRELREAEELFDAADGDDDGFLTEEEHRAFREPDRFPHTLEVLYRQTMARKDGNADGALTKEEFIANVDVDEDARPREFEEAEEDDDGDDVLTRDEILQWLRNDYTSEIEETVAGLMTGDDNEDGRLSQEELLEEAQTLREFPLLLEAAALIRALGDGKAARARVEL